jgi:uncharacterized repeat protein (TIGR01451 family)
MLIIAQAQPAHAGDLLGGDPPPPLPPRADLSIVKSDSPDPVHAGSYLTYFIELKNHGPDAASAVTLTDAIPAGTTFVSLTQSYGPTFTCTHPSAGGTGTVTCTRASLAAWALAKFRLVVEVDESVPAGTSISNVAAVTSTTTDPYPGNNRDTELTTVKAAAADLSVTKTDSPDPVDAGSNITYTITVRSYGPCNARDVTLRDAVPVGTTFVSFTAPSGWTTTTPPAGGTGVVTATTPKLMNGASATFTLVVNVNEALPAGTITNTATVQSSTNDPNPANNSATATTSVNAKVVLADLSVVKTDSPDPVTAGNNITYTITVNNAGPSAASNVTLTDEVPAGTTFVSFTAPAGWTTTTPAAGGTGPVTATTATLANGVTATFTLVVNVSFALPVAHVITNVATVASTTVDQAPTNNSDTELTIVQVLSDFRVFKTDSPDPVDAGSNITYEIAVNNVGPSQGTVTLTDVIPVGTTFVSLGNAGSSCTTPAAGGTGTVTCTFSMPPNSGVVLTLVVNVNAALPAGTVITNTATVASTTDTNAGNNSATTTTVVGPLADLSVVKTDSPDPVSAGSNITYTITVSNAGPSAASDVSLTDAVPVGTTFVSFTAPAGWTTTTPAAGGTGTVTAITSSFANGATATFTLVVNVNPAATLGTTITNVATVTSSTTDQAPTNNSDTELTHVNVVADLAVTKTDSPDPVDAGSNITYVISTANLGPSESTFTLTDVIPAGTTFVGTENAGTACTTPAPGGTGTVTCTFTLAPGFLWPLTLIVNVSAALPPGTVISNTATVTSTTDPNPANNSATTTTTVGPLADVSVTKTDSPDPVAAGANLTYTITVTNAGPSSASSVTLSDAVPAGTSFVSFAAPAGWTASTPAAGGTGPVIATTPTLASGATATFTLVVNVNPSLPDGTVLSETATVTSSTTDLDPADNADTETTTVAVAADLAITKTDSPDPVLAGANITYTLVLTNIGPSNAQDVTLTDVVPAGTTFVSFTAPAGWSTTTPAAGGTGAVTATSPALASGGSATFTLVVNVDASAPGGSVITNTATVTSTTNDPDATNNSDTETTTVDPLADLSVTKTDSPDPVTAGTDLTYAITVGNAGTSAASNVTLTDVVPTGTTFVSFTAPADWTTTTPAAGGTGTVTAITATFASGATAAFTLVVNVNASAPDGSTITNTVTVTSSTTDPNTANNSDTETTAVGAVAELAVSKTDSPDPVAAGSNISYTLAVFNFGPSDAQNVTMTDALPAGTTFVSWTPPTNWTCTLPAVGSTGTVTCTIPTIASGFALVPVSPLVVNVNAALPADTVLTNTMTISSPAPDPNLTNNTFAETTTVGP